MQLIITTLVEMPLGQLPVLEIDGKPYYQSKAICRLISKRNNLYGSSDVEAYQIDATVDAIDDIRIGECTSSSSDHESTFSFLAHNFNVNRPARFNK